MTKRADLGGWITVVLTVAALTTSVAVQAADWPRINLRTDDR